MNPGKSLLRDGPPRPLFRGPTPTFGESPSLNSLRTKLLLTTGRSSCEVPSSTSSVDERHRWTWQSSDVESPTRSDGTALTQTVRRPMQSFLARKNISGRLGYWLIPPLRPLIFLLRIDGFADHIGTDIRVSLEGILLICRHLPGHKHFSPNSFDPWLQCAIPTSPACTDGEAPKCDPIGWRTLDWPR